MAGFFLVSGAEVLDELVFVMRHLEPVVVVGQEVERFAFPCVSGGG